MKLFVSKFSCYRIYQAIFSISPGNLARRISDSVSGIHFVPVPPGMLYQTATISLFLRLMLFVPEILGY